MRNKLEVYLNEAFKPYGDFPALRDVKDEMLSSLQEKYDDLLNQGKSEEDAYQITINSIGDINEIMKEIPNSSEDKKPTNVRELSGSFLVGADLTDTKLQGTNLKGSALEKTDFTNANLENADLRSSDLRDVSFDGANLTGANLSHSALTGATFKGTNLTGTIFGGCALGGIKFNNDCKLDQTNFSQSDLSNAVFDNSTLDGVIFKRASLKNTSFKNAVLVNVSFRHTAAKKAIFDGATMDKLTYAILEGAKAKLNDIKIQ